MSKEPRRPGRHFLQIPGPTNVPDRVLRAIDMPTMELGKLALSMLKAPCQCLVSTNAPVTNNEHATPTTNDSQKT